MRLMQSRGEFRAHVTVGPPVGERVISINKNDVVDFDEIVIPARPGREQMTLRQALGYQAARTIDVDGTTVAIAESLGRSQDFDEYVEPPQAPAVPSTSETQQAAAPLAQE